MEYANFIAHCIEIARRGEYYVAPNPMVGAVLVSNSDERILAEGWHEKYGEGHAEVNCFRNYELKIKNDELKEVSLKDCTLFVSLEPCSHYGKTPPCAKLIIEKGVGRVVVGMLDPNPLVAGRGVAMLREAGIEVVVGVMEEECRALNKRFLCLHEQHRPYVVLKWAQTGDGFIDRKRAYPLPLHEGKGEHLNGALAISTAETKRLVHKMRAENMAIMVGTRTVLLDNPGLRTTHWEGRDPIRITVDRHHILPSNSRIFADSNYIVYSDQTDWRDITADLAKRNIHSILVEGGTTLLNHIIESGIWDEIHVEVAPEIRIGDGVPAPGITLPERFEEVDGHKLYTIAGTNYCLCEHRR